MTLHKGWKNITTWTACLSWTVTRTPDPKATGRWLIYGLVDPRTLQVRYIGQSQKGLERAKQHRNLAGGRQHYKERWVKSLAKAGLTFNIVVLDMVTDGDLVQLNIAEMWWIKYGRLSGWRLTNLTAGGEGCVGRMLSVATRAKISAKRRAQVVAKI